ncbi:TfoX/Sxy family DNA transformation protein [Erwinia psidii]|uniref:TfoX/Sxy family DNA transformation protein n=1 Tax=Erwinia psidii TaxID=69224 RepID=A0A3N6SAK8_9GAMM|nr:TfoX/Sxy family DNA transformation protein [Erwinia psidii]MCX8957428.1 TfoX/Sxy family DNA transformation protein [Erwinia psidii]MCX8959797.1 TfoX/Sxy family DNA transformation protein [Erwinia psidii]MCX8964742.1 TfoX/Sxy family DNA transformation protein [Erwinia psidii]RQM38330.1 TfoX/Sxy family DNA transformation protein [Erwinia psidii]
MEDTKNRIATTKDKLAQLGDITCRSQFGGYSLSVDCVVFALVANGELYLRACDKARPYIIKRKMKSLTINKHGIPVSLEYYQVDEPLWDEPQQLLALSKLCLQGAIQQRAWNRHNRRLKDLPNLTMRLEVLLRHVGISTVKMLKEQGSRRCWLKLHALNQNLGINVLFALEGAILGQHHEALPPALKAELRHWYSETLRLKRFAEKPTSTRS